MLTRNVHENISEILLSAHDHIDSSYALKLWDYVLKYCINDNFKYVQTISSAIIYSTSIHIKNAFNKNIHSEK